MGGDLHRRLAKVTDIAHARGCRVCRDWPQTDVTILPAGAALMPLERPVTCPRCGRRPPPMARIVIEAPEDENAG